MNDFKSYSNPRSNASIDRNQSQANDTASKIPGGGDSPSQLNNTVEMAKIISKAMNGKSTVQIMQTIISEAERGKRDGTLTNADLDNFYSALSPLLDGAKKRKLRQVIERLKSI